MANVLSDQKLEQVIALGRLGWALRRIEDATGVRRETAGDYLRAHGIPVRPPGRWGHTKPAIEVSTGADVEAGAKAAIKPSTGSRNAKQESLCEVHRAELLMGINEGVCAKVLWERLVEEKNFDGGYASVKRYVRKLRDELEDDGEIVGVIDAKIGEEAQVDYGEGPLVFDPRVGRYRKTRLFVFTLAWSRKAIRLLVFESGALVWAELHERAFRRLGGVPVIVILDNLAEGVKVADYTDPVLNAHYAAMLKHYGVVAVPARVRDPDRKGKVERAVDHAQRRFVGKKFESLDEAQESLDRWETNFADTRIHGTTKRQVRAMFEEEKPHLKPLPLEPWRRFTYAKRKVAPTGHIEVEGSYYEAPPSVVDTWVGVAFDAHVVRILDAKTQQLLIEHLKRAKPGSRAPRAESEAKRVSSSLTGLLDASRDVGTSIAQLCARIAGADVEELAQRRVRAVLRLAREHGAAHVDSVCAIAIEAGAPTHRFVKTYLEHHPPVPLELKQIDPLIRDLMTYRDVVARLTSTTQETT
jgi:transposase